MMPAVKPILSFSHRARATSYQADRLEKLVSAALPDCVALAKKHNAELAALPTVEITILGARAMAKVHRDFLGIPGATDVITFPYGEILLCAPVAAERSHEFRHNTTTELALYAIHGLLHLSGYDDTTPDSAKRMSAAQERILSKSLATA